MRVGLYLPGVSGPGSGAWTRLEDIAAGLRSEAGIALYVAVDDTSVAEALGVDAERVELVRASHPLSRLITTRRSVQRFVDRFRLDIVQLEAPPVVRATGAATVYSLHDLRAMHDHRFSSTNFGSLYQRFYLRHQLPSAKAVLALSEWAAGDIADRLRYPRSKIFVVPPATREPPTHLDRPPSRLRPLLPRTFVVALGHLEPRKNLDVLIAATYERTWPPSVTLVIAGTDQGSEFSLKTAAAASPQQILFLGRVTEDEKWWLLRNGLLVAVPSLIEGFGIVVLESIAAGTVVLVADTSALREVVTAVDARLPPHEASAWSGRIKAIFDSPYEERSLAQRQCVSINDYSRTFVTARLIQVYRALCHPIV